MHEAWTLTRRDLFAPDSMALGVTGAYKPLHRDEGGAQDYKMYYLIAPAPTTWLNYS